MIFESTSSISEELYSVNLFKIFKSQYLLLFILAFNFSIIFSSVHFNDQNTLSNARIQKSDQMLNEYVEVNAADKTQILSFTFAIAPTNKIYLIYNEQNIDNNSIKMITSDSNYLWNKSAETILVENETFNLFGTPTAFATSDELAVAITYSLNEYSGIKMLVKQYLDLNWVEKITLSNDSFSFHEPILRLDQNSNDYWLCWKDNRVGDYNLYYLHYNSTSEQWSNQSRITEATGLNSTDCDFILDDNGNAHFVWSEGLHFEEKILYKMIYRNGTQKPIEELTTGTTRCRHSKIIIDSYSMLNVFWGNYTVEFPGTQFGTKNIHSASKPIFGNWSEPIEVAPFIPPDRPASGESDASMPSVALDGQNQLWLAYEIREEYAYHQGVDIRERINLNWQPSTQLSHANNAALRPKIKVDATGNLHCFWLDGRFGNYELFHRIRFASGAWSDELSLTKDALELGLVWTIIIVVICGTILLAVPTIIVKRIRARRNMEIVRRKMQDLEK